MIDINLIPSAMRNNGKGASNSPAINIPKETVIGVIGGVIFLLLMVHILLGALWLVGTGRRAAFQTKWQALAADKKTLDDTRNESKNLKAKFTLLSGMTTQKSVLWSPKFNAISDAVPRGLWLKRMVLDKDGLSMEGSVVSQNQDGVAVVGMFLAALKQDDVFMKDFVSLEVNSIQRNKNSTIDVTDFTAMAKLK